MADQAEMCPFIAPVTTTTPWPAVQQHPEGSNSEANMWAQVAASDECSTSTLQLPEFQPRLSTPPTDWISLWLSNYSSAQPDAPEDPPSVNAPAFTNTELNEDFVDLGAWDPSSSIPKLPAPTLPRWVPTPSPSVGVQPDGSPGDFRLSWTTATPPRAPTPFWNSLQSPATPLPPVPELGRGVDFWSESPAKTELFLPHSAPVSTPYDPQAHSSGNPIFPANAFDPTRGSPAHGSIAFTHPNANSFVAIPGFVAACRPSWPLQVAPVGNWATNYAWGNGEEAMPALGVPLASFRSPVVSMPPWDPRAAALLGMHAAFQTGESSALSRERTLLAFDPSGGAAMLWNHGPSGVNWGAGAGTGDGTGEASREVLAMVPALNTNGKPRANRGSATDPQSVYARYRRGKISDRVKILQQLIPNGTKVDTVAMLDEAYNYIKFLERQIELLKSDEHWMLATPWIYNGMDLSQPQRQMPGRGVTRR